MLNSLRLCICNVTRSSCANYSIHREARMLQKFIDRGLKKKKDLGKSTGKLSEEFNPISEKGICSRRASMLSKVYVQSLMTIMSTGKNSNNLHQMGIHITKVKLSDNLKVLNIYWVSPNQTYFADEDVKRILDQTASELEYHVTSFRVTGRTPKVRFVRDLAGQNYLKVQNLLLTLKEEETSEPSTDPLSDDEEESLEKLREYTQDVLGLDHAKIMARIQLAKAKSKTFDLSPDHPDRGRTEKLIPFDRKTFQKFYLRKQILVKKMKKLESRPDCENSFYDCYEVGEDLLEEYYPTEETSNRFKDQLDWDEYGKET